MMESTTITILSRCRHATHKTEKNLKLFLFPSQNLKQDINKIPVNNRSSNPLFHKYYYVSKITPQKKISLVRSNLWDKHKSIPHYSSSNNQIYVDADFSKTLLHNSSNKRKSYTLTTTTNESAPRSLLALSSSISLPTFKVASDSLESKDLMFIKNLDTSSNIKRNTNSLNSSLIIHSLARESLNLNNNNLNSDDSSNKHHSIFFGPRRNSSIKSDFNRYSSFTRVSRYGRHKSQPLRRAYSLPLRNQLEQQNQNLLSQKLKKNLILEKSLPFLKNSITSNTADQTLEKNIKDNIMDHKRLSLFNKKSSLRSFSVNDSTKLIKNKTNSNIGSKHRSGSFPLRRFMSPKYPDFDLTDTYYPTPYVTYYFNETALDPPSFLNGPEKYDHIEWLYRLFSKRRKTIFHEVYADGYIDETNTTTTPSISSGLPINQVCHRGLNKLNYLTENIIKAFNGDLKTVQASSASSNISYDLKKKKESFFEKAVCCFPTKNQSFNLNPNSYTKVRRNSLKTIDEFFKTHSQLSSQFFSSPPSSVKL